MFILAVALKVAADQAPTPSTPPAGPEKNYTGTVDALDGNDHVLVIKGWLAQHKSFNFGDNCVYSEPGNDNVPLTTLRPGEKVTVTYQDSHGVLIADHVQQVPMKVEGMVTIIDPTNHLLTVHQTASNREFRIADNCEVVLRDEKEGGLSDIKTGSYVTVTYETPNNSAIAREIAQTSLEFTGTLTALDLEDRTIKAKAVLSSKKFHLADHCAIVANGRPDGRLADLKPEEKVVISYDEINGVNVVNRIAPAESSANHVVATGPSSGL